MRIFVCIQESLYFIGESLHLAGISCLVMAFVPFFSSGQPDSSPIDSMSAHSQLVNTFSAASRSLSLSVLAPISFPRFSLSLSLSAPASFQLHPHPPAYHLYTHRNEDVYLCLYHIMHARVLVHIYFLCTYIRYFWYMQRRTHLGCTRRWRKKARVVAMLYAIGTLRKSIGQPKKVEVGRDKTKTRLLTWLQKR